MPAVKNPSPITHHPLRIPYFPGCALKDQARAFELSALFAMERLGWRLEELPRWNCCGTVYSLASDDLIRHLGPVRNLIRVQELGERRLLTLCAMCYNTLGINAFMDEEPDYRGGVEVLHLLQLLRDEVGFEEIEAKVKRPLEGVRVAAYYGCMLLRPREVGILFSSLGAEPVDFSQKAECCGAYQTVSNPKIARERVWEIVSAARRAGAELIATSCPLCQFNLETHQSVTHHPSPITVVYFTQLLALALGAPEDKLGFELLTLDPRPVLSKKELV